MRNFALKPSAFFACLVISLAIAMGACQPAANNSNAPANSNSTGNMNASNTSNSNSNMNSTSTTSSGVDAREPEQYTATVTLKIEATGSQSISTPPLTANFARDGANRRVSIKLGGDEVVYLDRADKRLIVLPNRKQYAEIDAQSTGFNVPQVMTPAQIINQVKNTTGCTNAGEEQFGGRAAVKYRCAASANTGTQAGQATAESFIYVDKETNLPLRSESVVSSSGQVGGVSTVKIVTEMSNIQTSVPAGTFDEPAGMSKIDPAQVRAQVEAIGKAALIFAQNMMGGNAGGNGASASPPQASPSSSPTH